jgi:proteasome accessory factor B
MDKVERLMNLTATLLHTARPLTADEIRSRVPGYPDNDASFRRAFERDKDDLREMGIPIAVEPIDFLERPADGYRIHPSDYRQVDPDLEPDELAAINLALSAVELEGVAGVEALWKLGGTVTDDADQLVALPSVPTLVPMFSAVVECRTATFVYRGAERTVSRSVDPHRLDFQLGHWYVIGLDHLSGEERRFRLDRIEGEVDLGPGDGFPRPELGDDEPLGRPWTFGDGPPTTSRVRVDAEQATWCRRYLGDDAVFHDAPDGSTEFTIEVRNWPAFRGFLLSLLEHAELIEPAEWRTDVIEWLREMADDTAGATP